MNFDSPKHKVAFVVPLMYPRILLTILQCSLPGFAMNWLTVPTACAMSGLVQIIANIKLPTVDAIGIEPLKTRHDVTKLDLTIPLLFLLRINIDLIIQSVFLTLYMTWVH